MRWRRLRPASPSLPPGEDPYPLATFLKRLRKLTPAEAETVERLAETAGIGASREWSMATEVLVRAATEVDRGLERASAASAAASAIAESPAGRRGYRLAETAAGLMAQVLGVRQLVDRTTWDYAIRPWAGVATFPAWGTSGIGSASEASDRIRTELNVDAEPAPQTSDPAPARRPTWDRPFANPRHDPRLLLTVAQPGMSIQEADTILDAVATEVSRRAIEDDTRVPELSPTTLVDLARACRGLPFGDCRQVIRETLDQVSAGAAR